MESDLAPLDGTGCVRVKLGDVLGDWIIQIEVFLHQHGKSRKDLGDGGDPKHRIPVHLDGMIQHLLRGGVVRCPERIRGRSELDGERGVGAVEQIHVLDRAFHGLCELIGE